jgi:hypothetical protein
MAEKAGMMSSLYSYPVLQAHGMSQPTGVMLNTWWPLATVTLHSMTTSDCGHPVRGTSKYVMARPLTHSPHEVKEHSRVAQVHPMCLPHVAPE